MTKQQPTDQEVKDHEKTEAYAKYLADVKAEMTRLAGKPMNTSGIAHLQLMGYTPEQAAKWLIDTATMLMKRLGG